MGRERLEILVLQGVHRSLRRKILMIFDTKYGVYEHMIGGFWGSVGGIDKEDFYIIDKV